MNDISLFEAAQRIDEDEEIPARTKSKIKDFVCLIEKFRNAVGSYNLREFVTLVIEKSGYLAELQMQNTPESEADIENLQEFVNVAEEFTPEETDNQLSEFLQQVALVSDLDNMENYKDAVANYEKFVSLKNGQNDDMTKCSFEHLNIYSYISIQIHVCQVFFNIK